MATDSEVMERPSQADAPSVLASAAGTNVQAMLRFCQLYAIPVVDQFVPAGTGNGQLQITAARVQGRAVRITGNTGNTTLMLPSLLTLEAPPFVIIMMETAAAGTVSIYPYVQNFIAVTPPVTGPNDTINGVATGAAGTTTGRIVVSPGGVTMFLAQTFGTQARGGGTQNLQNWTAASFG